MPSDISKAVEAMRAGREVRFGDLCKVCEHYFGTPRQVGTSHRVYKTPWAGDPRVNIQSEKGKGKAYQIRQVLRAIDWLQEERGRK